MNRTRLFVRYLVLILILVALAGWVHWDMKRLVRKTSQEREQATVDALKDRLFPYYEEMKFEHEKNPKTLIELLDPLLTGNMILNMVIAPNRPIGVRYLVLKAEISNE